MPILEPEYDITAADRTEGEEILLAEIIKHLDALPDGRKVMLKLSIPATPNLYAPTIAHPNVLRVVALSGGYSTDEACARRSEEHTSELQSLMRISYAVFCLKKKKNKLK